MTEFTAGKNGFQANTHTVPAEQTGTSSDDLNYFKQALFNNLNNVPSNNINNVPLNNINNIPLNNINNVPFNNIDNDIILENQPVVPVTNPFIDVRVLPSKAKFSLPNQHQPRPIPVEEVDVPEPYGVLTFMNEPIMTKDGKLDSSDDAFIVEAPSFSSSDNRIDTGSSDNSAVIQPPSFISSGENNPLPSIDKLPFVVEQSPFIKFVNNVPYSGYNGYNNYKNVDKDVFDVIWQPADSVDRIPVQNSPNFEVAPALLVMSGPPALSVPVESVPIYATRAIQNNPFINIR